MSEDRVKRRHAQRIGDVVSQLMSRRGYGRIVSHEQYAEAWKEIAGEDLARNSRVGRFGRGVLEIVVNHPMLIQELSFRRRELVQGLQKTLPQLKLRDVKFVVGATS